MSTEDAQAVLASAIEALHKETEEGLTEAEAKFNYLLDRNPHNAELWFWVATCTMKRNKDAVSEILLRKSLEIDPKAISVYNNLGYVLHRRLRDKEAMEAFNEALRLLDEGARASDDEIAGHKAQIHNNISSLFSNNGTPELALEHAQKAIDLTKGQDKTYFWNRAFAHLEMGNWEQGFLDYEVGGFVGTDRRKDKTYGGLPMWDGDPSKRVVVYGEQGIGDEIMFASIIPDMEAERVIYDAHPRLQPIMQDSFPGMPIYGTRKGKILPWVEYEAPDARIAIGSLASLYRKQDSDFPRLPYLSPNADLVAYYRKKYPNEGRPRIGIHWKGGYMKTRKDLRSVTPEQLLPIMEEIDAEYYSFQYTLGAAKEVEEMNKECGTNIIHDQTAIDIYHHTAALVSLMDVVISVNTSLVHLCGGLGVKCFTMTPVRHAWRYGMYGSKHMPFYGPHIEQVWQREDAVWNPVIEEVINRARDYLGRVSSAESSAA